MKRWKWALLFFELVLFAVILVLPQVELPIFTVHGGTAPVAAKLRVSRVPVMAQVSVRPLQSFFADEFVQLRSGLSGPTADPSSRLTLLCVLIC